MPHKRAICRPSFLHIAVIQRVFPASCTQLPPDAFKIFACAQDAFCRLARQLIYLFKLYHHCRFRHVHSINAMLYCISHSQQLPSIPIRHFFFQLIVVLQLLYITASLRLYRCNCLRQLLLRLFHLHPCLRCRRLLLQPFCPLLQIIRCRLFRVHSTSNFCYFHYFLRFSHLFFATLP